MSYPDKTVDDIVEKVGNRFLTTMALSRRIYELRRGYIPLVPVEGKNLTEIAIEEFRQGKFDLKS